MYYKGDLMNGNFEVTAKEGSTIKITGKAIEHDNVPDVGSGSVSLVLQDGNEAETTFYVRENRGKYCHLTLGADGLLHGTIKIDSTFASGRCTVRYINVKDALSNSLDIYQASESYPDLYFVVISEN